MYGGISLATSGDDGGRTLCPDMNSGRDRLADPSPSCAEQATAASPPCSVMSCAGASVSSPSEPDRWKKIGLCSWPFARTLTAVTTAATSPSAAAVAAGGVSSGRSARLAVAIFCVAGLLVVLRCGGSCSGVRLFVRVQGKDGEAGYGWTRRQRLGRTSRSASRDRAGARAGGRARGLKHDLAGRGGDSGEGGDPFIAARPQNRRGMNKEAGRRMVNVEGRVKEGERKAATPAGSEAGGGSKGGGKDGQRVIVRHYRNFTEYSLEQFAESNGDGGDGGGDDVSVPVPIPIVTPADARPDEALSLPAMIIIGVQKGGTQNLRSHLLTHPMLSGQSGKEAHFFDWNWPAPKFEWPGVGNDERKLGPREAGFIIERYAERSMDAIVPADRDTKVGVDSTPLYVFHPLTPFRLKMVLPRVKMVVLLRDPTERYFSHARMTMCWTNKGEGFEAMEKHVHTYFHSPGAVQEYLKEGEASYTPYTPLCRGEKATAADLTRCYQKMDKLNPLFRGLYADQLERWFRVFDRSQILIVESGEMFQHFTSTLELVARHAGLPPHDFKYDPVHQHASKACEAARPELFAKGGRYDQMLKDEQILRDWYRPHNQRLYRLLGREMPWE